MEYYYLAVEGSPGLEKRWGRLAYVSDFPELYPEEQTTEEEHALINRLYRYQRYHAEEDLEVLSSAIDRTCALLNRFLKEGLISSYSVYHLKSEVNARRTILQPPVSIFLPLQMHLPPKDILHVTTPLELCEYDEDHPSNGLWYYCVRYANGWTHPVGYCLNHCPGHTTAEDACQHFAQYLLHNVSAYAGEDGGTGSEPCTVCGTLTSGYAEIRDRYEQRWPLCTLHCEQKHVRQRLRCKVTPTSIRMWFVPTLRYLKLIRPVKEVVHA